ncbi:hypothetical protein FRC14_005924 [Serendipita sp. 396]|nr:hypothetical protein FRC14_005924 [Serendipita sp. 396]
MSRRNSKIRQTLSWITGSGPTKEESKQASDPKPPDVLRSFLPSLKRQSVDHQRHLSTSSTVEFATQTLTPATLHCERRPPPFFYPRPLDGALDEERGVAVIDAETSVNSLHSSEIALWTSARKKPTDESTGSSVSPLFAGLAAFLNRKRATHATVTSAGDMNTSQDLRMNGTRSASEFMDSSSFIVHEDCNDSSMPELSYSEPSLPEGDNLMPPPRPKRKSVGSSLIKLRGSIRKRRPSPGIDPAKWAEISISAADLIRVYGRENVAFPPPINRVSIDSLDDDSGMVIFAPGKESFIELSDDSSLNHSLYGGQHNMNGQMLEGSSLISSLNASMASFSKWPLPPHYNHFESNPVPS